MDYEMVVYVTRSVSNVKKNCLKKYLLPSLSFTFETSVVHVCDCFL